MRIKLTDEQIDENLRDLDGWSLSGGQIEKEFSFDSYARGVLFAVTAGHIAEQMDHHPDLDIRYRRVRVALNTHDVGGISPLDFEFARRLENL
jgi:4a-hydroxytetrahydrobiopterin dehydratase